MFIGCLSSPKQQKESFSEKVSDTLVVVKDTENVDERHLKKAMADALVKGGLRIVSGGTDNHLMLVDLRPKGVTGKLAEESLEKAGITCNKNAIPNDPEKPFITSGVRLGTPAITARGMKEDESVKIAEMIIKVLENVNDDEKIAEVKNEVLKLTEKFPLYKGK